MLLVEKCRMNETQINSNVAISVLEEDTSSIKNLTNELDIVGLNYVLIEKSKTIQQDYWYWKICEENLKKSGCLVMILSKTFFEDKNEMRRRAFWYEAGIMEAKGQNVIPFLLDIDKSECDKYINTTPIRQTQATSKIADVIMKIEEGCRFKKNFFKDRDVSLYGNSRVFYSRLSVLFNIKNDFLDTILNRLKLLDDDIQTRNDILKLLQKEVNFGVVLHRFGRKEFIEHPYYSAYIGESNIINLDCGANNIENRFCFLSQNNISNSMQLVRVDFVVPNHEVLGVSIKPYMDINRNSAIRKNDLVQWLKSDSGDDYYKKIDIKIENMQRKDRVYFNLYFGDDNSIIECNDDILGNSCNFFYAK